MTETLANGYSSESTRRELSNEYQHNRIKMVFKNICLLVLWTKISSALEGLTFCLHLCLLSCWGLLNSSCGFIDFSVFYIIPSFGILFFATLKHLEFSHLLSLSQFPSPSHHTNNKTLLQHLHPTTSRHSTSILCGSVECARAPVLVLSVCQFLVSLPQLLLLPLRGPSIYAPCPVYPHSPQFCTQHCNNS